MSKILTIGRDTQCDICLNDPTDVVSRRHAVLECVGGKYYLTDQSRNGTYINGMKMARGERVPVTRRDEISFAHVCNLDWTVVPKPNNTLLYAVIGVGALAVLAVVALLLRSSSDPAPVGTYGGGGGGGVIPTTGVVIPQDSTTTETADSTAVVVPEVDATQPATTPADTTVEAADETAVVEPTVSPKEEEPAVEPKAEEPVAGPKVTPAPKKQTPKAEPKEAEPKDDEVIDAIY